MAVFFLLSNCNKPINVRDGEGVQANHFYKWEPCGNVMEKQ